MVVLFSAGAWGCAGALRLAICGWLKKSAPSCCRGGKCVPLRPTAAAIITVAACRRRRERKSRSRRFCVVLYRCGHLWRAFPRWRLARTLLRCLTFTRGRWRRFRTLRSQLLLFLLISSLSLLLRVFLGRRFFGRRVAVPARLSIPSLLDVFQLDKFPYARTITRFGFFHLFAFS